MTLPRVDLPQPDSPTRPSVSPAWIARLTPSTACTTLRPKRPLPVGKYLTRSSTRTIGDLSVGSVVGVGAAGALTSGLGLLGSRRSSSAPSNARAGQGRPHP